MSKCIFITGGVRSGKSAYAEKRAISFYKENKKHLYYFATGVAFDDEMKKRIVHHQDQRNESQVPWETIEFESEIPDIPLQKGDVLMWDCITTWVNNVLYVTENKPNRLQAIQTYIETFKKKMRNWIDQDVILIIVSNEVLDEPTSTYEEVNLYKQLLGELHQWIVKLSDEAYEMDYSLVLRKK